MAENEQAEGAAEGAEAAPPKKGKLKLIIAAVGVLAILGGGAALVLLLAGHGEEKHAEAPPPKPPAFVEVPDMLVNLVGAPGERVQYLKRQGRARGQGREAGRGDQAEDAARHRYFPDLSARIAALRPQRLGRPVSPQGRTDQAGQCRGRAACRSAPCCSRKSSSSDGTDLASWPATTRSTRTQLPPNGRPRSIPRIPRRPRKQLPPTNSPGPWRCNGRPWSRTAAATSAAARTAASGCCRRRRSTICSASLSATSISTTIPAFARSSIRRWSPTSVCRCSKSSSTAWCG